MQIRSRMCAREFKSDDWPDLYAGTPPLEVLKAIISIGAKHKDTFSTMHVHVSRAYFHAKAQRPVLVRQPVGGLNGQVHVRNEGRGQQLRTLLARARQELGIPTWTQLEESVSPQGKSVIGFGTR